MGIVKAVAGVLPELCLALLLLPWLPRLILVKGASMRDTLLDRDLLLAFPLHGRAPRRGEIVICLYPGRREKHFPWRRQRFVKRVIGLPGETLSIHEGIVQINGLPLWEPYLRSQTLRGTKELLPQKLGEQEFFVMGDNRANSRDSRAIGPLPRRNLLLVVRLRLWPPKQLTRPRTAARSTDR